MQRTIVNVALLPSAPAVPASEARTTPVEPITGRVASGAGPYRTVSSRFDD